MKLTQKLISVLLVLVMLVGLVPAVFAEQAQASTVQPVAEAGGAKQAKSAPAVPAMPAAQPEGELVPEEDGEINGTTKFVFDFGGVLPDKVVIMDTYGELPRPPKDSLIEGWYYNKEFTGGHVDFNKRLDQPYSEFRIYAKWDIKFALHYPDRTEQQNWRVQKPKDDMNIVGWYMEPGFKTLVNWDAVNKIRSETIHLYARKKQSQVVSFIDYDSDGNRLPQPGEKEALPVSQYHDPITLSEKDLTKGWYVVSENFTANGRITVNGNVSLILKDGCTLEARNGIFVPAYSSLTIYAQSEDKNAGAIRAYGRNYNAGIGGDDSKNSGDITINGGKITASADHNDRNVRGIGTGYYANGGTITINAGTVRSTGIGGRSAVRIRNNPLVRAGSSDVMREVRSTDYGRELNREQVVVADGKSVAVHEVTGKANLDMPVPVERVEDGGKLDMPLYETETGYVLGWYKDERLTQKWNAGRDTVTKDMTLYARTAKKLTVTFDSCGIGTPPENMHVKPGEKLKEVKLPDTEDDHFVGWYTNPRYLGNAWNFGRDTVTRDMTLYAKWEKKCIVTFDANGHGVAPDPVKVIYGEKMKEVKPADTEGVHFAGWYRDKSCRGRAWNFQRDTVLQDMTLYAKWEEDLTVTFDANGYGTAPAPVKIRYGEKIPETKAEDTEDMHFVAWYRNKECTGDLWNFKKDVVQDDMTLYAKWEEKCLVVFDNRGYGVTPDPIYVVRGEKLPEVKPEGASDMRFAGWYPNSIYSGRAWDFKTDIVKKDMILYAKWEKKTTPVPHYGPVVSTPTRAPEFKLVLTIGQKLADLNGKSLENDVAPVIRENRTMLPIAFIVKALGGTIDWNAETRTVTITLGDTKLMLTIGSKVMMENGKEVAMDVAPFISENRTYLPLSFVADALGAKAAWDEVARTVTVTK